MTDGHIFFLSTTDISQESDVSTRGGRPGKTAPSSTCEEERVLGNWKRDQTFETRERNAFLKPKPRARVLFRRSAVKLYISREERDMVGKARG